MAERECMDCVGPVLQAVGFACHSMVVAARLGHCYHNAADLCCEVAGVSSGTSWRPHTLPLQVLLLALLTRRCLRTFQPWCCAVDLTRLLASNETLLVFVPPPSLTGLAALETANQEVCEDLNNMLYMDDAVALMSIPPPPPYTHRPDNHGHAPLRTWSQYASSIKHYSSCPHCHLTIWLPPSPTHPYRSCCPWHCQ